VQIRFGRDSTSRVSAVVNVPMEVTAERIRLCHGASTIGPEHEAKFDVLPYLNVICVPVHQGRRRLSGKN